MSLFRLIFVNLSRHRIRSLIGSAGIAFGVAAMLSVLSIVLGAISMFEKILSSDSHFLVFEKNVSDLFFSSVPNEALDSIKGIDYVETAWPMLFGIVSSESKPVITCFGLAQDDTRLNKATWISGDRASFGLDEDTVYLGSRAAQFIQAKQGDEIPVGRESFKVGGILKMENGFEDGGIFMPIKLAQAFFHKEGYSSIIAVKLKDTSMGDAFKTLIKETQPELIALENEEFSQSYSQFKILTATAWGVGVCAFLLGGMSVANTMLMAVFGRVREIAILRVCGFSKRQVGMMIVCESLLLACLGAIVGLTIGYISLRIMQDIPNLNGYIRPVMDLWILLGVALTAFITSIGGAAYPAWMATKIQPSEALRYE